MRCLRSFTAKWPKELTAEAPALGHAIAVWRERRELAAGVLRACAASLWRVGLILSAHGAEWRGPIAVLRIGVAAAVGLATIQAAFLARRLTTVAGPGQGRRGPEPGRCAVGCCYAEGISEFEALHRSLQHLRATLHDLTGAEGRRR